MPIQNGDVNEAQQRLLINCKAKSMQLMVGALTLCSVNTMDAIQTDDIHYMFQNYEN